MMNSILTKALMKHHNEFFTLSKEDQDVWKLQEHDDIDDKVREYVLKSLGLTVADANDDMSPSDTFLYNKTMLPYTGIGDTCFMMNEHDWNGKILRHANLYEYNCDYHEWQEEAFRTDENFPDFTPTPLYNRLSNWARAFIDGEFHYLNLTGIQWHINWIIDDIAFAYIDEVVPHNYVDGPKNGDKVEGGYLWDMKLDAHGLEGWYEQIRDFSYKLQREIFDNHKDDEKFNKVFIIDKTEDPIDPSVDYIFGSMEVLKSITFTDFISDCNKVKGNAEDLNAYVDKITVDYLQALKDQMEEIKKTAPNVVKLEKRRKIVMSEQAMDDIMEDLNDDV